MKAGLFIAGLVLLILIVMSVFTPVWLHGQAVQYKEAQGYMPDTIIVSKFLPDKGRICLEPTEGGLLTCKTVGELRKWVFSSKAK